MAAKGDLFSVMGGWGECASTLGLEQQVSPVFDECVGIPNLKLLFWFFGFSISFYLVGGRREKKFGTIRSNVVTRFFFFLFLPLALRSNFQHAGGVMDSCGCRRESTAATGGSPRRDRTNTGVRAEPLDTCALDRYRTAKFSLAAYLLCWLVLRWYQVRARLALRSILIARCKQGFFSFSFFFLFWPTKLNSEINASLMGNTGGLKLLLKGVKSQCWDSVFTAGW